MIRPPIWLVASVMFCAGAALSGELVRNHYLAEIANLQATQAKAAARAEAEAEARAELEAAQFRGDALSADLAKSESALNQKTLEVTRAVSRLTVGRPCLGAAVVSVLNHAEPAPSPAAVPEAPGAPVAADAAAATDTDVAEWVAVAWGQYDTCRGRLGALIDWEERERQ